MGSRVSFGNGIEYMALQGANHGCFHGGRGLRQCLLSAVFSVGLLEITSGPT
jgi:hypothetical protein